VIRKNFPQFISLLPLIAQRRQEVARLHETVKTVTNSTIRTAAATAGVSADASASPNAAAAQSSSDAAAAATAADSNVGPNTDVVSLTTLAVDIRNRRALSELLRASAQSFGTALIDYDARSNGSSSSHGNASNSTVARASAASTPNDLRSAIANLSVREGSAALVQMGASLLPQLAAAVPALAERNAQLEQSIVSRLLRQRVDFFQTSRYPVSVRWWGVTIDLAHDDVARVFSTTNWLMSLSTALQAVTAGEPHAAVIALVLKFASMYGAALALIDRGSGIRFCVPYLALAPIPNPLLIVPTPLV
jgi:hypothetical protein